MRWITDNPQLFKPPVANKEVFPESEFIFQIIRGPNARNDFDRKSSPSPVLGRSEGRGFPTGWTAAT
jgi:hypothetical protein